MPDTIGKTPAICGETLSAAPITRPRQEIALQRTLAQVAVVEGFGFWSSKDVRVEFHPAPDNTGLVFVRDDLDTPARIPALVENRIEMPRRTTLTADGASVEMVEHILAALAGLGIDNCEIHVNECEMPGCDGSSESFVTAINQAGTVAQNATRRRLNIRETTRIGDDECWIEARPSKSEGLTVKYRLEYADAPAIGRQTVQFNVTPEFFTKELASARTFMLQLEAEWLQNQPGIADRVTPNEVLIFTATGPINNELRFDDECARHKALDLIGDFALAGCEVQGQIIAHKSGHRLNADLVSVLLRESQILEPRRLSA